tara:strand:+ start:1951 stop:2367 length:417 start_codon:yes stop_codon:yes gene_type:complete
MKIKTFVFAVLMCLGTVTFANEHESKPQTPEPEIENQFEVDPKLFDQMFRLPSLIDCGPPAKVMEMLQTYEETPFAQGKSFVLRPDGMLQPGPFTLFANPKTGSWSLVIQFTPEGFPPIWCITAAGSSFGPVPLNTSI